MASFLTRFADELRGAVIDGVITADQARLLNERAARRPAARLRGIFAFGLIAGLLITAGLCLIIAHNWDLIPASVKIIAFLLILLGAGEGSRRASSPAVGIPLDALWFFLPLLGIGLVAQIFQLSGDPVRPFLLWAALTAPLAWALERRVALTLHVLTLFFILFYGNFGPLGMMTVFAPAWGDVNPPAAPFAWPLTAVVAAAIAAEARMLPGRLRVWSVGGGLAWVLAMLMSRSPFRTSHEPAIALAFGSAAAVWLASAAWMKVDDRDRKAPRVAWFAAVYLMTFFWHARHIGARPVTTAGLSLVLALAAAGVILIVLMPDDGFAAGPGWRIFGKATILAPLLLAGLAFDGSLFMVKALGLGANVILVTAAVGLMVHGVKSGEPGQIDQGLLALVLLLITRFIDVFGTFLKSGSAFLFTGILMALGAWLLHRSRGAMMKLSEERRSA